jgi:hypothetical protein
MSTHSPSLYQPGTRRLSAKEQLQRLQALSCTLPQDTQPACSGQVFIGVFFDGTDNNRQRDYVEAPQDKRSHTNIVRLFHTHKDLPESGYFSFYIPGVGTPFDKVADSGKYWQGISGSAAAAKGEARIAWGLISVLNAVHRYVYKAALIQDDQAQLISNNGGARSTIDLLTLLKPKVHQLKAAITGKKPRIEQINLSVFGFSRGAAQARAFCNWLFELCEAKEGGWQLAGVPLRVNFLGIFDTVASVGSANILDNRVLSGHMSWADDNLEIHPGIERCVHYVAGHENRACFPLDSVRIKSTYPANAYEVMYPGSHSDVGGGYAPGDLGVSHAPNDFISIIPGVHMYHEARKSGVPLLAWHELDPQFQSDLTPSDAAIKAFNDYLHAAGRQSAAVETLHQHHMSLYFSHRFKHRAQYFGHAPYTRARAVKSHPNQSSHDQESMRKTQEHLMHALRSLGQGDPMQPDFNPRQALLQRKNIEQQMTKATGIDMAQQTTVWKNFEAVAESIDIKRLTPEIEHMFSHYMHDSAAGFIGKGMNEFTYNRFGFAKFRTVFKGDENAVPLEERQRQAARQNERERAGIRWGE